MALAGRKLLYSAGEPTFATSPGTWCFDNVNEIFWYNPTGSASAWYSIKAGSGSVLEQVYMIPKPWQANWFTSDRTAQTNFDGAAYVVPRRSRLNRISFYVSSVNAAPTLAVGLYQRSGGRSGSSVPRVLSITGQAVADGVLTVTIGTIILDPGLMFLLWGRDSVGGSFALSGRSNDDIAILNIDLPAAANAFPITFTTALACNLGPPATVDPTTQFTPDEYFTIAPFVVFGKV